MKPQLYNFRCNDCGNICEPFDGSECPNVPPVLRGEQLIACDTCEYYCAASDGGLVTAEPKLRVISNEP